VATAEMNVWVTRIGDPCHVDTEHQWFVHVLDCDGRVLRWCGPDGEPRPSMNIKTQCGARRV
jgi:hypothetical protein